MPLAVDTSRWSFCLCPELRTPLTGLGPVPASHTCHQLLLTEMPEPLSRCTHLALFEGSSFLFILFLF